MSVSAERSAIMRAVKGRDTGPEVAVRRLLRGLGYRFSVCRKDLPGKPDIVVRRIKRAVFVHGCFWHGHSCRRGARIPKTNEKYWLGKVDRNRARDKAAVKALKELGWKALVIWECETRDEGKIQKSIARFLAS